MEDVLFYNNYSAVGDICTISICIIFWILLNSTYTIKQKNLLLFKSASILVTLASAAEIIYHKMVNNITIVNKIFIYLTRHTVYISLAMVFGLYITYIKNLIETEEKEVKIIKRFMYIGFIVFVFF